MICYFVEYFSVAISKQLEEDRAVSKTYENKYEEKYYFKDYVTADTFTE